MELDLLSGFSVAGLKALVWVSATVVGVVTYLIHRNAYWPIFEAILTYILSSIAVVVYVLTRPSDPRWSNGEGTVVNPPGLPSNSFTGPITDPLNSFLDTVSENVNELFALRSAFTASVDFLIMIGWAIIPLILSFIVAQVLTRRHSRREMKVLINRIEAIERATGIKSAS